MKVKAPKAPPEDPMAKLARERERVRADAAYSENTAALLDDETRRRVRRLGRRSVMAGTGSRPFVPILGGGGGGALDGRPGGGGLDAGGGGGRDVTVLV